MQGVPIYHNFIKYQTVPIPVYDIYGQFDDLQLKLQINFNSELVEKSVLRHVAISGCVS